MFQISVYACEHEGCNKILRSKQGMQSHESKCFYNPDKKACATCDYYENTNNNKRKCHQGMELSNKPKSECNKYDHDHVLIWGVCHAM